MAGGELAAEICDRREVDGVENAKGSVRETDGMFRVSLRHRYEDAAVESQLGPTVVRTLMLLAPPWCLSLLFAYPAGIVTCMWGPGRTGA